MNAMAYEYVPVPAFDDNYIWVVSDGHNAIVVDPGEAIPIRLYLAKRNWRLTAILLTHYHNDHVGGVINLLKDHSVPVYGPAKEDIACITYPLSGGDHIRIEMPMLEFMVIDVPGHTRGHIAYFQEADLHRPPHVFCGDTLFSCGCGRLFEGTPIQMLASLDRLAALPRISEVHCAHEYTMSNIRFALICEPANVELNAWSKKATLLRERHEPTLPTTIAHECAVNPFMRVDSLSIHATLSETFHETVQDRLTAFTLMRKWKNQFR